MTTATSSRPTLAAEPREVTGKKVALLRREGRLPAVVFGHGIDSENVSARRPRVRAAAPPRRPERPDRPVGRRQEGRARSSSTASRSIRSTAAPLHVDLFLVRMTEELTVDVPLVATGTSKAIENEGGTLAAPDRARPDQGAAGSPAAVDRVLDRLARRLRRRHQGLRPRDPVRRHAADRPGGDRRQGPGAARRARARAGRRPRARKVPRAPRARPRPARPRVAPVAAIPRAHPRADRGSVRLA